MRGTSGCRELQACATPGGRLAGPGGPAAGPGGSTATAGGRLATRGKRPATPGGSTATAGGRLATRGGTDRHPRRKALAANLVSLFPSPGRLYSALVFNPGSECSRRHRPATSSTWRVSHTSVSPTLSRSLQTVKVIDFAVASFWASAQGISARTYSTTMRTLLGSLSCRRRVRETGWPSAWRVMSQQPAYRSASPFRTTTDISESGSPDVHRKR